MIHEVTKKENRKMNKKADITFYVQTNDKNLKN